MDELLAREPVVAAEEVAEPASDKLYPEPESLFRCFRETLREA